MSCSIDLAAARPPTLEKLDMLLRLTLLAAALAAALAAPAARGHGEPPAPDHGKVATEDATPVGAGVVEVEAAYSPNVTNRGWGSFERSAHAHAHGFSLSAAYGVSEDLDLKVGLGAGYVVDLSDPAGATRGSGLTDVVLGARWRFLADAARALDLAVTTAVVAPTGEDASDDSIGMSQGHWSVRNALVASKDWGRATANAAVALTLPVGGGAGELEAAGSASLAFGYALAPWLQPMLEVGYDAVRDGGTQERVAVTAGLSVSAASGHRLLLGVQQAVWGRGVAQTTTALVAVKTAF
jgi:hypothetical protein